jgi:DNA-binding SARP family transcriptional activator/predicted ATPase
MTTLRAQFFGGFLLALDQTPLTGLDQPRYQRLLAFLLLHRSTPLSRQRIAFLFWPDSTDAQARTNLRNLFYRLRQVWPEMEKWVETSGPEVGWLAEDAIEVDVERFEQALDAAGGTDERDRRESLLHQAIDLYAGDLLPDIYDDWALQARERLRSLYAQALEQLAQLYEEDQRYAEAIECCQQRLRHEPLQENVYRDLMRLYAASDDRAAALRIYHTCATTLERELGVEPSPQTRQAYERLLNFAIGSRPEAPVTHALPLVGRQRESRQMYALWQEVTRKQSRLLLISGEAGIGKTRLAEDLVERVRRQGHAAATARSYAAEGGLAYAPVAEWLRSPALHNALEQVDDIWLVESARLLPEILQRRPNLPTPGPLQEDWQRQRFFEGLARLLAAAPQPLLLLLDDMQWADPATLEWLHFLLRSSLPLRLLLVGTVRREAVDSDHPLAQLTRHLQMAGRLREVALGPLSAGDTARLAEQAAGKSLSADAQTRLFQMSEGHPLYLVETVRAKEGYWVSDIDADDTTPTPNIQSPISALPPKIQAVIGARLAQLSAAARQLAGLAAVMGRAFTFAILAGASDRGDDELVQALDELWQRGIVAEQGADAYDFSHGYIREVAYGELSRVRRRLLHRRVAVALENLYAAELDAMGGRIGAHYEAASEPARAVHHYFRGGEHALSAYLPAQAVDLFAQAVALAQTDEQKVNALFGLGRAHFAAEAYAAAVEAYQQALALVAATGTLRGRLLYAIADVYYSALYDLAAAEPYIRQALAASEAVEDWETVSRSLSLLGQHHSSRWGNLDEETRLNGQALAIARRTDNRWREGRVLADLAFMQGQQSDFAAAAESAGQALDLLQETDDRAGLAFVWNILGRAAGGRGEYRAAFAAFAQSEAIASAIEHRSLLAQIPNMRGWLHQQLCDYTGALAFDQAGVTLAQEWGKLTAEVSARLNLCLDWLHLGEAPQALDELARLESQLGEKQYGYHAWRWRLRLLHARGLCCLALGRVDDALGCAAEGLSLAQSAGAQKYVALNHELAGAALAALGRAEESIPRLQAAVALADRIEYQPLRWQGRWRLALTHQQRALACQQRAEMEQAASVQAEAVQIIEVIAAGLTDESLRQTFLTAGPVRAVLLPEGVDLAL